MSWNHIENEWQQIKHKVKEEWNRLTDSDLEMIGGNREQLENAIQERYGIHKDKAKLQLDQWFNNQQWLS